MGVWGLTQCVCVGGVAKSAVEAGEVVSLDAIPSVGHETVGDGIKGDGSWMSTSLWIPNWAPLKPEEALELSVAPPGDPGRPQQVPCA